MDETFTSGERGLIRRALRYYINGEQFAIQKAIMGLVKDDAILAAIAAETELFTTDGKTITLA